MAHPLGAHEAILAWCLESTYGQLPGAPFWFPQLLAEEFEPLIERSNIKVPGVGSRDLYFIKKGLQTPVLKVKHIPQTYRPYEFIEHGIMNASEGDSMYIEAAYTGVPSGGVISLQFAGCKFNKIEMACGMEQNVVISSELWAQRPITGTAKINTANTPYAEAPVSWVDTYIKKAGSLLSRCTDWRWTLNNNLKRVPVFRDPSGATGADILMYLQPRHRTIDGELIFEFESKAEADDIIADTEFTLEIGMVSTLEGRHKFTFAGCKWASASFLTKIEDLVPVKCPFTARSLTLSVGY